MRIVPREPQWLDAAQQRTWRALVIGNTLLMDQLEADLRRDHQISMTEYEILVRLSESPGRAMRMARLADSLAHSRSRVTHTVGRMEASGLVQRADSPEDGRGVVCQMTEKGFALLESAAGTHVAGVRRYLVDVADPEDYAAMGRVMNAVCDELIGNRPGWEIRAPE